MMWCKTRVRIPSYMSSSYQKVRVANHQKVQWHIVRVNIRILYYGLSAIQGMCKECAHDLGYKTWQNIAIWGSGLEVHQALIIM